MTIHGSEKTSCEIAHIPGLLVTQLIINAKYTLETLQINYGTRKVEIKVECLDDAFLEENQVQLVDLDTPLFVH